MANETKILGNEGLLYIWDSSAYRPVACLTSHSLTTALSVLESNTKCNPGVTEKQADQFSYDIACDGEYIDTTSAGGYTTKASHDYLLTLQQAKTLVTWKLDSGLADTTYYGYAYITDLDLTQPAGEISTFSATLSGSGSIVTTDPTVT